jgi:hypothetical protein
MKETERADLVARAQLHSFVHRVDCQVELVLLPEQLAEVQPTISEPRAQGETRSVAFESLLTLAFALEHEAPPKGFARLLWDWTPIRLQSLHVPSASRFIVEPLSRLRVVRDPVGAPLLPCMLLGRLD